MKHQWEHTLTVSEGRDVDIDYCKVCKTAWSAEKDEAECFDYSVDDY